MCTSVNFGFTMGQFVQSNTMPSLVGMIQQISISEEKGKLLEVRYKRDIDAELVSEWFLAGDFHTLPMCVLERANDAT